MNRHAKQLGHAFSNAGESAGKAFDKIGEKSYDKISQDYQDKMDKAMQGDEFKDAMHEGKTEDDIQQAREKMQEQDYQKELMKRYQKTSFSGSAVEFIRAYLDSQELTAEDLKAIRELVEKKQQEVK